MITTEIIGNRTYTHTDSGCYMRQVETQKLYVEAWDIVPCPYTYVETDIPVPYAEWVQPTSLEEAYMTGDHVRHNEKDWVSYVDYNMVEPGIYGWNEENRG